MPTLSISSSYFVNNLSSIAASYQAGNFSLINFTDSEPAINWTKQFGMSDVTDYSVVTGLSPSGDGSGDLLVIGHAVKSGNDWTTGNTFITKADKDGNTLWTDTFDGGFPAGGATGSIVSDSSGNAYIESVGSSGSYLAKLSLDGSEIWRSAQTNLDTTISPVYNAVAVDHAGYVYAIGNTTSGLSNVTNNGGIDGYLAKYDQTTGVVIWQTLIGSPDKDLLRSVITDSQGNVYVAGTTNGNIAATNSGGMDGFVAKYSSSGSQIWKVQIPATETDPWGNGASNAQVVVDKLGNVYIAGTTSVGMNGQAYPGGIESGYLTKLDASGYTVWTHLFGSTTQTFPNSIALTASGNIAITGFTVGSLNGQPYQGGWADWFSTEYGADGTLHWTKQIGTDSNEAAVAVAADSTGGIYFGGYSQGNFNGLNPTSNGNQVGYVVKMSDSSLLLNASEVAQYSNILSAITSNFSVTITDTAGHVSTHLDNLQSLNSKISSITLSDSTPITVSVAQLTTDHDVIAKITNPTSITVSDTADHLSAAIDQLEAMGSQLGSVVISDYKPLTITEHQLSADSDVLGKISGGDSEGVNNSKALITELNLDSTAYSGYRDGLYVMGLKTLTLAPGTYEVDYLQKGELGATFSGWGPWGDPGNNYFSSEYNIVINGQYISQWSRSNYNFGFDSTVASGKAHPHTFTLATETTVEFFISDDYIPDNGGGISIAVYKQVNSNYQLKITDVIAADATTISANPHVISMLIADSSANVSTYLDSLESVNSKITSITLNGSSHEIDITAKQKFLDTDALAKITGDYTIHLTDGPFATITSAAGLTNQLNQTITGTGQAGTTVTVLDGATVLGTAMVANDGTWSDVVTLNGQGNHIITASAADTYGNVQGSSPVTITLDTIAPIVTITSPSVATSDVHQTITGTGEAGTTVTVLDGSTVLGTTTVDNNGTWADVITLANTLGAHNITATDTDAAGNLGTSNTDTLTLNLVINPNPAPVITATGNSLSDYQPAGWTALTSSALNNLITETSGGVITQYRITDTSAPNHLSWYADGHVATGQTAIFSANQLAIGHVMFNGLSLGSDTLSIQVFDGQNWSNAVTVNAVVQAADKPMTIVSNHVSAAVEDHAAGGTALSSLITIADGGNTPVDTLQGLRLLDTGTNGGYFTVNGVKEAANTIISVDAADVGSVKYYSGTNGTSEQLYVAANDGYQWTNWYAWNQTSGGSSQGSSQDNSQGSTPQSTPATPVTPTPAEQPITIADNHAIAAYEDHASGGTCLLYTSPSPRDS